MRLCVGVWLCICVCLCVPVCVCVGRGVSLSASPLSVLLLSAKQACHCPTCDFVYVCIMCVVCLTWGGFVQSCVQLYVCVYVCVCVCERERERERVREREGICCNLISSHQLAPY